MSLWSFQGARDIRRPMRAAGSAVKRTEPGLSKLNSVRNIEVDILLGELGVLTAKSAIKGPSAYGHELAVSLERR